MKRLKRETEQTSPIFPFINDSRPDIVLRISQDGMGELIRRKYTVYRLDRVANRVRTCPERVSAVYISVRGCATVYDSLLAGITASQLPF